MVCLSWIFDMMFRFCVFCVQSGPCLKKISPVSLYLRAHPQQKNRSNVRLIKSERINNRLYNMLLNIVMAVFDESTT